MSRAHRRLNWRWLAALFAVYAYAVGLAGGAVGAETASSRLQDLSDEISRLQSQIELLRSQGRHGEAVVAAQRLERLVDSAAKALDGGHDDSAEVAWLILQRWQDRAAACVVPEASLAVVPAAAVTELAGACAVVDRSIELAVRARSWAVHRRDAEHTPPNYEQLTEFAMEQQGRVLAVRARLPVGDAEAVPRAQVPPPHQQWPWSDADRADAAGRIRAARAGKPLAELVPGAVRWLGLAVELEGAHSPLVSPWVLAQFLLRAGQVRGAGAVGSGCDGACQLGRASGDGAARASAWLAGQRPKKPSADPKDWAAEERAAFCDQPSRPCAPLRLASLPPGAELDLVLGANVCSANRKLTFRFKAGKQLTGAADGCPAVLLSPEQREQVDQVLGWYVFPSPQGSPALSTSAEVRTHRGARVLAQEAYAQGSAGVEAALYQLAADLCAHPNPSGRAGSRQAKTPSGAQYEECVRESRRKSDAAAPPPAQ